MTSSSSGIRSSALRRVAAVRENVSSARLIRRSWSVVNFVGRVKSTVRMRRWRARSARRLLGQPAVLRGLDERRDRIRGQDLAAHAATRAGIRRVQRDLLVAGRARRDRLAADRHADRAAARAARVRRGDGDAQPGELRAHGFFVALADLHGGAAAELEHAGAADEHRLERDPPRAQPHELGDQRLHGGVGELAGGAGAPLGRGEHDVGQARDGRPLVHEREADARAQAQRDEHVTRDRGARELAHADHGLGGHLSRPVRGGSGAPARRRPSARAGRRSSSPRPRP